MYRKLEELEAVTDLTELELFFKRNKPFFKYDYDLDFALVETSDEVVGISEAMQEELKAKISKSRFNK